VDQATEAKPEFLVGDKTLAYDLSRGTKEGIIDGDAAVTILTRMVGVDAATAAKIAVEADPLPARGSAGDAGVAR
jgi:hypothetical protein